MIFLSRNLFGNECDTLLAHLEEALREHLLIVRGKEKVP